MNKLFRHSKAPLALALALLMTLTMALPAASASIISDDGRYYADYDSYEAVIQAAAAVTEEVAAEGEILLKNDGALPMVTKGRVTVFGISQVNVIGAGSGGNFSSGTGGMSIAEALEGEGFVVNERIVNAYKAINSTERGNETPALEMFVGNPYYEQTYAGHNDAAFIIISRDCAEGSDKKANTGEKSAADAPAFDETKSYVKGDVTVKDGVAYKFTADHTGAWDENHVSKTYSQMAHAYPATVDGVAYKHELQFTDSEEELIQYVQAQGFKKIVLLVNSSNAFELADAHADENIDAILWMGRPGADGLKSFAKIMIGEINPSGRLVDLVFTDFTKDPTWQNVLNNAQNGSSYAYASADGSYTANGVEYEEDIYMGYRYAETAANEAGFDTFNYDTDVLYPFGYGLSYSTFAFNSIELYAIEDGKQVALAEVADLEAKLASGEGNNAEIKQIVAMVEVENTGDAAGKQVVEVYVNAPYVDAATSTQKAHVVLAGFGKTDILQPGQKETVEVTLNVQDFASYDAANLLGVGAGYTLEKGDYRVLALSDSHAWDADYVAAGKGFGVEAGFTLTSHIMLGLDDYTDNEIGNLFSAENGMFYTLRTNDNASEALTGDWGADTPAFNANNNDPMTLMVRGNFANTMPAAPTADALLVSDDFAAMYAYWYDYVLDGVVNTADGTYTVDPASYADAEVIGENGLYVEKENMPWLTVVNEFMTSDRYQTITQKAEAGEQKYSLSDMSGIDPVGQVALTEKDTRVADFVGKTGEEAWDLFLNELTWGQLVDVVTMQASSETTVPGGSYMDYGIEGNGAMSAIDSPLNLGGTYQFADNPTLAATWNLELARRQGEVAGNIALYKGYNRWWGPTVNLHRSPFCGRNHEYFSSDPLLCGYMAATECSGAQSRGLACCPKHAILNEQETGRSGLMTFASEQAIRELYAKPLQMLVQEGEGLGTMGAMNRIGSLHNYGNYNFITGLLHDEWNMRGSYTTDMGGSHGTMNPELMIRAGLNDVNNGKSYFSVGAWDASLRDGKGSVKVAVGTEHERESFAQYYATRYAAMWCLYMHANSAMNDNGYDIAAWTNVSVPDGVQGIAYTGSITLPDSINAAHVLYSASGLPEGMTMNPNTGAISGIPTAAGDITFQVTALLDSWITVKTNAAMHVAPAFTLDVLVGEDAFSPEDNVINAKVGDEVVIDALSEHITAVPLTGNEMIKRATGFDMVNGAELTLRVEGDLPAGLEMDEVGSIFGFVETAGTYEFVIVATHKQINNCIRMEDGSIMAGMTLGSWTGEIIETDYEIPVTLVVE